MSTEPFAFPDPAKAEGDLIAWGGDLSPETLLSAYSRGIFPWYSQGEPIIWWSLDPRFVLFPSRIHIPGSLKKKIRKKPFRLTLDTAFEQVISLCRLTPRPGQDGTWITAEMQDAYIRLHRLGYAHSAEAWVDDKLAGGLYGVSLGGCFCGESMFAHEADASKIVFSALCGFLADAGFGMIDCQQHTTHLAGFGAVSMPRSRFLENLGLELDKPDHAGHWNTMFPDFPDSALWRELGGA